MKSKILLISITLLFVAACSPGDKSMSVAQKRQLIVDMEEETLNRLYSEKPSTRERIKEAPGYGVFSNANINIIFVSAGGGYGVVVGRSVLLATGIVGNNGAVSSSLSCLIKLVL